MTITDANALPEGTELTAPVCIVGGGPAGLALAMRLDELGVDSLVLEGGGDTLEDETQALYEGESGDYFDLTATRLRMLGGTTNHYGGQSRPLEEVDLEAQPWRAGMGWPIPRSELLAEMPASMHFLGLLEDRWEHDDWFDGPPLFEDPDLTTKLFQGTPLPVAALHRSELEGSERIRIVLHANVTAIRMAPGSPEVSHLEVSTLDGPSFTATADAYVLATGGIEAPRLLLASDQDAPAGVGNSSGLVGAYFTDHPAVGPIEFVPGPTPTILQYRVEVSDFHGLEDSLTTAISPTAEAQRRLEMLGFHVLLTNATEIPDDQLAAGMEALVSLGADDPFEPRAVLVGMEQVPRRENRITLSDERNALGERQARLEWGLDDDDEESITRAVGMVARLLARTGVGRLRTTPPEGGWATITMGQHHHMGTLRMSASPTEGVVDPDLRFHDVPNLWATGSAVFPTHGHVNPTLNIVALARRLGGRLQRELGT